ncbi:MAG: hypothetical protein ACR650_14815 [Methylocystis sp.]
MAFEAVFIASVAATLAAVLRGFPADAFLAAVDGRAALRAFALEALLHAAVTGDSLVAFAAVSGRTGSFPAIFVGAAVLAAAVLAALFEAVAVLLVAGGCVAVREVGPALISCGPLA